MFKEGKWVRKSPSPHSCAPPQKRNVGAGSLWKCKCGQEWFLNYVGYDPYGRKTWTWFPVEEGVS